MKEATSIRHYMKIKKMTTQELADKTGIKKRYLDEYISGRRELTSLGFLYGLLIAKALEVDPWDLFSGNNSKPL